VRFLLRYPALFHRLRRLLNGDYLSRWSSLLELKPGDRLLDVGCGVGEASCLAGPGIEYLGIDIDPEYIAYARRLYGRDGVEFSCQRLEELEQPFSKAIVVCVLHHLSASEVARLGQRLRQLVTGPVGIVDPDAARSNRIQRLFLHLDRGDYALRPICEHLAPLASYYRWNQVLTRDTRLRGARLTYSVCTPV